MNVTLSLDGDLIEKVQKMASERETTINGLVQDYLEKVALENFVSERQKHERDALDRTFERFQINFGKRTWTRADLHVRA